MKTETWKRIEPGEYLYAQGFRWEQQGKGKRMEQRYLYSFPVAEA